MATIVKVRGTDVTAHVQYPSLKWEKDLDARIYLCNLTLKSTSPVVPQNDDYVEVTQTDGVTKAWTGIVRQPDEDRDHARVVYPGRAVGWAGLAKETRLANSYTTAAGNNDSYIVRTILDLEYGPIGTGITHVLRARRANMPSLHFPFGTFLFRRRGRVPSSTPTIQKGLGRFVVKRVGAQLIAKDSWTYDVEIGEIDPIGGGAIGRA